MGAHVALEPAALVNAERCISSAMEFGFVGPLDLPPEVMPTPDLVAVAGVARAAWNDGRRGWPEVMGYAVERPTATRDEQDRIRALIATVAEEPPHRPEVMHDAARIVMDYSRARDRQMLVWQLTRDHDEGKPVGWIARKIDALESNTQAAGLELRLEDRAFVFDSHPEKPVPRFRLCDLPICTAGNLMNIQALPKAGKSAVVESEVAAVFNGNRQGQDTLGFAAENTEGYALIHFDTEQSRYDHDALVRRAIRRARVGRTPDWFHSYSVADLDITERRQALRHAITEGRRKHGGVFAVLIDGIGDLCADPNDAGESFDLVHELHALAITNDCTIITVLHENPGSESAKTRGHLGSQLERKAETNLRLCKDKDGITTIWAERARHCHLPKENGPCFAWNDHEGMHTSCGTAGEIKNAANRERMQSEAERAFAGAASFRHADLMAAIGEALELKERASKLRVQLWASEGIIIKDSQGNYHLSNP